MPELRSEQGARAVRRRTSAASEQGARAGERAGATSRRQVGDDVDLNLAKGVICWGMARLVPAGLTSRH